MITNERQSKVTRSELKRLKEALRDFDEIKRAREGIDPLIIVAQRESLRAQISDLEGDLTAYEQLKSGNIRRLFPDSVTDIGKKLVDARIAQGWTQRTLADRLGMKEQQIQRYEKEKYLTANLGRIAEIADALQLDLFAFFETRNQSIRDQIAPNLRSLADFDLAKLPVKEMKKRGWLEGVATPVGFPNLTDDDLAAAFVSQALGSSPTASLHSQHIRTGSKQDFHALLAWKARILERAKATVFENRLNSRSVDLDLIDLLPALSAHANGPAKAVDILLRHGIVLVFEAHFAGTHLDGAAMLLDEDIPVIGMTLRHDRLDNFWFVLAHEIAHIALHREHGLKDSFFDDEETATASKVEKEADEFAKRVFVSDEIWRRSFVRFTTDKTQVRKFASDRHIGVAIVAGRIRRERDDYTVFSDLVGAGTVRKLMAKAGYWRS